MKRLFTILALTLLMTMAHGQGLPFIRNFTVDEYHANNTNYDIEIDENGIVFVANFEGLLYYDNAEWRILHAPGITRTTVVYKADDNTIWVGGYNFFGKVVREDNGTIALQRIGNPDQFRGEVFEIYERDGELLFATGTTIFQAIDDKIVVKKEVYKESLKIGVLDVVNIRAMERGEKDIVKNDTLLIVPLSDDMKAVVRKNAGIDIVDANNRALYSITDANGLCSNNVSYAAYDGRGHLWGVTGKGIFVVNLPAAISHFTTFEGLPGAVLSIEELGGAIYAGTDDGLYRQQGYRFVSVPGVAHACWDLKKSGNSLLAATADGIHRVYPDGRVRRLTNANTMSLLEEDTQIYSGENDGIYLMQADGQNRRKVFSIDNVRKIVKDKEGTIWVQSIYGMVYYKRPSDATFRQLRDRDKKETMKAVVMTDGKATIVSAESTEPFPYPLLSYVDDNGVTWLTDSEGKKLYRWKNGKRLGDLDRLLFSVNQKAIHSIYTRPGEVWLGDDDGLIVINTQAYDPSLRFSPKLFIRSIRMGNDSILWGGFGQMPESLPRLGHKENTLTFTFSLDYPSITGPTWYRYRLNNGNWSSWSTSTSANFPNLSPGNYTFSVQARDIQNRITDVSEIKFSIAPPFYEKWYMNLLYLLLLVALAYGIFRLRLRRLEREKVRLENIVQERSAEVVRLEKMATAGKLTQGLIDRILNPLNYINNFAKLSEGLVRDVRANVEEEKEHFDEENYDDTMDVLSMIEGNLQKVGEHGQNTTRTLKAMEEMLKDRSGGIVSIDLLAVVRNDREVLHEYYKQEIAQYGIQTSFENTEGELLMKGNADQLSKTIMSLLGNAVFAVVRKAQRQERAQGPGVTYTPQVSLRVTRHADTVEISIRDNGIGIEDTIIDKIFDPFFTTKTTAEAAGVGLYLSREIVQNHGGDIHVDSVKGEYSEFTITLPVKKA